MKFVRKKGSQVTSNISKKISKHDQKMEFTVSEFPTLDLLPYKRIMNNHGEYIDLRDYGYMQILELPSKDTHSLGSEEEERTLINWYEWLSRFPDDFTIYTTKLPTDTTNQINYQKRCLSQVRQEMNHCRDQRYYLQLRDREMLLMEEIRLEGLIRDKIYNVEFIMFLFGDTIKNLDETVRKAGIYGNDDFVPRVVSREKKIQIITQFNNMNESI